MKKRFTLSNGFIRKNAVIPTIGVLLFSFLFFIGCYEWRNIFQPETGVINSYFDVWLSAQDDGDPGNDWTNPDLHDLGLFGVMLPVGWTVQDSIYFFIKTTEQGYDNDGILIYSAARSQTLTDSIPPPPDYYWWGSATDGEASLVYFDSLYLEPRIFTDDQTGDFFLRYAIGDVDYWDRNPADNVSNPIPITISDPTGIDNVFEEANISLYPNPTSNILNIDFDRYRNQVIDLKISDILGKILIEKRLLNSKNKIQLGEFAKGMYIVSLRYGNSSVSKKIFVE